ncbi:MAG: hypothetical protein ACK5O8_19290 [Pirellula sp.]|jgi:uncharacterized membrane protein YphA (DoxX/SURF4 family)/polyhydroxyalkanoate synthesis regulator phasin
MLLRKAKLSIPAIIFLVLLRLAIGWHFFQEGVSKVRDGGFSSTGFLSAAKGPFAKKFQSMIPDYDGSIRIDAKKMSELCKEFGAKAVDEFGLNEAQRKEVDDILAEFAAKRKETYDEWKSQIEEYKNGLERIEKLESDATRSKVESLRKQRDEIESKWRALGRPILAEIDQTIPQMVERINAVPTDEQANPDPKKPIAKDAKGNPIRKQIEFKYPGEGPLTVRQVDKIIPIFDMVVGILLLVGLLTPLAAIAAGVFLLSVVATQFPGAPGSQPTYYQAIEMLACFVVAFADAGRYAGLDFIPWSFWNRNAKVPSDS